MTKDLIVIGSYPNTDLSLDVLRTCILNLNSKFDVVLTTHYPVGEEIQKLVKYYVFDSVNDIIDKNNPIVWFATDIFYLQIKHTNNYAYSAYSCMLNALNLLHKKYDYFYYINGDTLINSPDLDKLDKIKDITLTANKKGLFFKEFDGMVDSKIFFANTKFFMEQLVTAESKNDFVNYTSNFTEPYVPNVLESFFCERIDNWVHNDTVILNENLDKYFPNSEIDALNSFNGQAQKRQDYNIHLIKENISDRIFFVYFNNNQHFQKKEITVKINNEQFVINNGNYAFYKEVYTGEEYITLEVDGIVNQYSKKDILSNKDSHIRFN